VGKLRVRLSCLRPNAALTADLALLGERAKGAHEAGAVRLSLQACYPSPRALLKGYAAPPLPPAAYAHGLAGREHQGVMSRECRRIVLRWLESANPAIGGAEALLVLDAERWAGRWGGVGGLWPWLCLGRGCCWQACAPLCAVQPSLALSCMRCRADPPSPARPPPPPPRSEVFAMSRARVNVRRIKMALVGLRRVHRKFDAIKARRLLGRLLRTFTSMGSSPAAAVQGMPWVAMTLPAGRCIDCRAASFPPPASQTWQDPWQSVAAMAAACFLCFNPSRAVPLLLGWVVVATLSAQPDYEGGGPCASTPAQPCAAAAAVVVLHPAWSCGPAPVPAAGIVPRMEQDPPDIQPENESLEAGSANPLAALRARLERLQRMGLLVQGALDEVACAMERAEVRRRLGGCWERGGAGAEGRAGGAAPF
jgi:hypothetical protein